MINHPTLCTLTAEDLNQRYAESYVDYDGQLLYIQSFKYSEVTGRHLFKIQINAAEEIAKLKKRIHEIGPVEPFGPIMPRDDPKPVVKDILIPENGWHLFDGNRVNIERIPSGWYEASPNYAYYLYYTEAKQFCRGYHYGTNTFLFSPYHDFNPNTFYQVLKSAKQGHQPERTTVSFDSLMKDINTEKSIRFSSQLLGQCARGNVAFYFRRLHIATLTTEVISMVHSQFQQELEEVITGAKYRATQTRN